MRAGRFRRLLMAALMLSGVISVAQGSGPVSASGPQTWEVTVSGDCAGSQATSTWQSVFGVDPTSSAAAAVKVGDTLRVVNNCDAGFRIKVQDRPNQSVTWPTLTGVPIFSDNATFAEFDPQNDPGWKIGDLNNGSSVSFILASNTGQFRLDPMLAVGLAQSSIFSNFYGRFAVADLSVTSGGSPVTQILANQSSAITPFTVTFSGYGARSAIEVSGLPPGLTDATSCVGQGPMYCNSPLTIQGTPTQDGTFNVTFTGWDNQQAWGTVAFSQSLTIIVGPAITPLTQTVTGTGGSAITPSSAFTAGGFANPVAYSVTTGTLPAGLTMSSSTGVISGTPSAASSATVTITGTDGTDSATATVTFAITAAPPPPPPPAAPVTTAPPSTAPPATLPNVPTLVNNDNQSTLTRTPGGATAIVNGEVVDVEVEAPADLPAAQKDPEDRSPAEVAALQDAAESLVDELNDVAGGSSGLSVVPSPTGASISGLMNVPVPIENTVIVKTDDQSTVFAALNQDGSVTEVQPGAQIEVLGNGQVGVAAFGLTPGETVEIVLMSTPTLLGRFEVSDQGGVKAQAQLPETVGSGNHTLVVASPTVKASLGLKVGSAVRPTLPVTGTDSGNLAPVLVLLAVGAVLVIVSRRRVTLVP